MAYNKKTWLARLGQGLNKFIFNGGSKVTLDSAPDVVTQAGTPLSADNMNDLEQRIADEFSNVNGSISSLNDAINAIKGRKFTDISASNFDEFLLKLATALHNEYNPLDTFMCWIDWSGYYTYLVQGLVQSSTSVLFTIYTYSNGPSYCVLVYNGVVYMNAL